MFNTKLIENAIIIGWDSDRYREHAIPTEGKTEQQILDEAKTFLDSKKLDIADKLSDRALHNIDSQIKADKEEKLKEESETK